MIEESPFPWLEVIETLWRRRALIIVMTIIGLLLPSLFALSQPLLYRANARILLTAQAVSGPRREAMSDKQIKSELALLRSSALIRTVLESQGQLEVEPPTPGLPALVKRLARAPLPTLQSLLRTPTPEERLTQKVQNIRRNIEAVPVETSNIVRVAFMHTDREWAAVFVNDLLAHHVERIASLNEQNSAQSFFNKQKNILAERLKEARKVLSDFRRELGPTLLSGDQKQLQTVITRLQTDRVAAETKLLELNARAGYLSRELETQPTTINSEQRMTENRSAEFLRARILQLQVERSELLSRYTPTSQRIRELERQIEETLALLAGNDGETLAEVTTAVNPAYQTLQVDLVEVRSEITAIEARLGAIEKQLGFYRGKLSDQENVAAELKRLQDEVDTANEAYLTYLRKEEEARLSSALDESRIVNLSILEQAEAPNQPVPTKHLPRILTGTIVGLMIGIALGFFRDLRDPTIKSSVQARRLSGLPVIAEIPSR